MRKRILFVFLLMVFVQAGTTATAPRVAAAGERCFAEVPFCIHEPFLRYWEQNGGLAVFGFPITDVIPNEVVEGSWVGPTQWYERDRLEDHGSAGVMAGRMGARLLELQGRPWQPGPGWSDVGCQYFDVTRYAVCGDFLTYWRANGGLARFGYPISTELTETIGAWTGQVQYFERRRMERHPEHAGTPYAVLLGRLAADIVQQTPPQRCTGTLDDDVDIRAFAAQLPFRERMGCPTGHYLVDAVWQTYAGGRMIWLGMQATGAAHNHIIATYTSSVEPGKPTVYAKFVDEWVSGVDPEVYLESTGIDPVAHALTYPIARGFGKVWFRAFRRGPITIAPALSPETPTRAIVQTYSSGGFLIKLINERIVYAYGPDNHDVAGYLPGR